MTEFNNQGYHQLNPSVHVSQQKWKYSTVDQSSIEFIAIRGGYARVIVSPLRVDHVFPPIPFVAARDRGTAVVEKSVMNPKVPTRRKLLLPPNLLRHLFLGAPWLIARDRIVSDGYRSPIESRMTVNYSRLRYLRVTRAKKGDTETPAN